MSSVYHEFPYLGACTYSQDMVLPGVRSNGFSIEHSLVDQ